MRTLKARRTEPAGPGSSSAHYHPVGRLGWGPPCHDTRALNPARGGRTGPEAPPGPPPAQVNVAGAAAAFRLTQTKLLHPRPSGVFQAVCAGQRAGLPCWGGGRRGRLPRPLGAPAGTRLQWGALAKRLSWAGVPEPGTGLPQRHGLKEGSAEGLMGVPCASGPPEEKAIPPADTGHVHLQGAAAGVVPGAGSGWH